MHFYSVVLNANQVWHVGPTLLMFYYYTIGDSILRGRKTLSESPV